MWERTLIESKGYGRATKARWTIPVAASLHVGLIVTAILASYWHVEAVEAPPSSFNYLQSISVALTPPPKGIHHTSPKTDEKKNTPPRQDVQPTIVPPLDASTSNEAQQINPDHGGQNGFNLPEGEDWGVDGGDQNSTSFGENVGLPSPLNDEPRKMTVNMTEPVLLKRVEPVYPRPALVARIQGVVILEAIITKTGSVEQVKALRSDHMLLEKAAKDAVLQWRYKPATLHGQPVKVYFTVTVTFHLR